MRILLVGEYSRLHNSLQEGLRFLGHEVTLIATGDYFKDYPADIKLNRIYDSGFRKKIKVGFYKLFGIDITSLSLKSQFFANAHRLKGYDVVQLINESPLGATPEVEKEVIAYLKAHNKKLFLLCCGTDYVSVKYALSDSLPYSIFYDYKNGTAPAEAFKFILKYVSPSYKELHEFIYERIDGVIASDMDYHLALETHPKYLGLIPNPVNTEKLKFIDLSTEKPIVIFMGINRSNYYTKGIVYFEEALKIIRERYSEEIKIEIVENLPYSEYISTYNSAHIVLDQVFAYDQGYNALEAMAKGKVVFTGAETKFTEHYNLKERVAINALPTSDSIVSDLENLILNPEKIKQIGQNARGFIEKEHNYKIVAKNYLFTWSKNNL